MRADSNCNVRRCLDPKASSIMICTPQSITLFMLPGYAESELVLILVSRHGFALAP